MMEIFERLDRKYRDQAIKKDQIKDRCKFAVKP